MSKIDDDDDADDDNDEPNSRASIFSHLSPFFPFPHFSPVLSKRQRHITLVYKRLKPHTATAEALSMSQTELA